MTPRSLPRTAVAAVCLVAGLLTAGSLASCGGDEQAATSSPSAAASAPAGSPAGPAAGSQMAPGLYDLADGTVVAVGTVEYRDLEGGFWAVVDGSAAGGDPGAVVAVIANGDDFADRFREGAGRSFEVYGERAGEASVRMAGPEIVAARVVLAAEGGPAE